MIRLSARHASFRLAGAIALVALSLPVTQAIAQQNAPAAPVKIPAAPATGAATSAPSAPKPTTAPVFPKPKPSNFTALSPTKEVVNSFLQATWGWDTNRVWQVQAIMKTRAAGVSRVIVLVGDKTGKQKTSAVEFYVMPDGKHLIAGNEVANFGEDPFAETRQILEQRANGPYRGSASKDLELVEFADFECPHCKEAQANMEKLAQDFPNARIVFQFLPLESIHPEALLAAEYALCVNEQGGSKLFFQYAGDVFNSQDGLMSTTESATMTLNSAVVQVGLEPTKIAACAALPATKAKIAASVQLARDLGIDETPTLMVNGRGILADISYNTLKKIIQYQAQRDGVALAAPQVAPKQVAPKQAAPKQAAPKQVTPKVAPK